LLFDVVKRRQKSAALIVSWYQNNDMLPLIGFRPNVGCGGWVGQDYRCDNLNKKYSDWYGDESGTNY
jgi:hypothetical protein